MSQVPVLRTARLVLREHRLEDFEAYAAFWANADIIRFIGGKPLDEEAAWSRLLRYRGMWATLGFGFWVIEMDGRFIGEAGVHDVRRAIDPPLTGTLECGWAIDASLHGKGIAREAVDAFLEWADTNRPEMPQSAIIATGNAPSIALARKVGFEQTVKSIYHGAELLQFRRQSAR